MGSFRGFVASLCDIISGRKVLGFAMWKDESALIPNSSVDTSSLVSKGASHEDDITVIFKCKQIMFFRAVEGKKNIPDCAIYWTCYKKTKGKCCVWD